MSDHMHIARERFLELMAADPGCGAEYAAVKAIEDADAFMRAYSVLWDQREQAAGGIKWKGCKACHGSGGKTLSPCKTCCGTGKVPV